MSTLCEVPQPNGIVMTANKTMLVSSKEQHIYKVTQKGTRIPFLLITMMIHSHHCISGPESYEVTVLAGCGERGSEDGTAAECSFCLPHGLVVDESTHSCYVAEWGNDVIRKISFAD